MMFHQSGFQPLKSKAQLQELFPIMMTQKTSNRRDQTTGVCVSNGKTLEKVNGPGINGNFEIQ